MEVKYLQIYNSFLTELTQLKLVTDNTIELLLTDTDEKKINNGLQLSLAINSTTNFNYLLNSKIKLFSHKNPDTLQISESLFGKKLSLKKIFNNQSEDTKNSLWNYIHNIILVINKINLETNDDNKIKENISKLEIVINNYENNNIPKSISNTKSYINKIINNDNLNSSTNEMIDDIVKSFESVFTSGESNPFQNIMEINDKITNKYKDKIDNGEINLNQIMESLQKNIPGIGDMNGLSDMLSTFTSSSTSEPKETVIMDENFSTADINQGELESDKPNMVIGNMLKSVESLTSNFIDTTCNNDSTNQADVVSGSVPDMSKLMGIFNKLGSLQDAKPDELQNIIENELGLDMSKISEQMSKMLGPNI
jgi:hypothetical protein